MEATETTAACDNPRITPFTTLYLGSLTSTMKCFTFGFLSVLLPSSLACSDKSNRPCDAFSGQCSASVAVWSLVKRRLVSGGYQYLIVLSLHCVIHLLKLKEPQGDDGSEETLVLSLSEEFLSAAKTHKLQVERVGLCRNAPRNIFWI
jgi:hypothetical protein